MLNGIFVTGTGTNVGKTVVSAALMHRYRDVGLKYWKPIQTGVEREDDTETVRVLGGCANDEILAPGIRLHKAVAPYLAAELSGTRITISDLDQCLSDEPETTAWVVEGVGGLLVPINESEFVVDLISHLGLPVLVVASSELGTINLTLLTLEALRNRTINIAGVIMVGEKNPANRNAIERWGAVQVLGEMPRFATLNAGAVGRWAALELDVQEQLIGCFR